jgi:DNA recombination protein RmuC
MTPGLSLLVILILSVSLAACLVWAMAERGRAARAELAARLLSDQTSANAEILKAQAAQSATAVAETLLRTSQESFQARDQVAQARIEAQLKPVAETLAKFEAQLAAADQARARESGGLKVQIEQMLAAAQATQEEARKLSSALKRGAGVQGRWGEQMLRNVLELAGMRASVDFEEQFHLGGEGGALRPDVVVRLAGGARFVIDAKVSTTAYLAAQEAVSEIEREAAYDRHAQSVRNHIQSLSAKAYWDQFDASPDFVAMFVPGDALLAAAAERLPDLYTLGMERRVVLVTPSSLFALCKAVVYGWRMEEQHVNARQIADLGRELHKRLSAMGDHVGALGKALGSAVVKYNDFVGSLESQVLTQARRFEDLKVDYQAHPLKELAPLQATVRPLMKLRSDGPQGAPVLTLVDSAPNSPP